MIDPELDKNFESSAWVKKVLNELESAPPKFKNTAEAITALNNELSIIAKKRSISVAELLALADSSVENHEDLDRSLRISSLIHALKSK